MDRREFTALCSGLLAGSLHRLAHADSVNTPYPRTRLMYPDDTPVTLASLETGVAHIFSYPYQTTPCFLVRLKRPAPARGQWPGGIDTDQTVVAFSAICSHKMSHPARPISHIAYREQTVTFYDKDGKRQDRDDVISCCSERSVYDPGDGAAVLAGPAPAPLAAIVLSTDKDQQIVAEGSVGADQYEPFLERFGFRLAMEYGITDVRRHSGDSCVVTRADQFSSQQVLC